MTPRARALSGRLVVPFLLGTLYTAVIAVLFLVSLRYEDRRILEMAIHEANAVVEQVVAMRAWNAEHGGVYAVITEKTQPNPYLDASERELIVANGVRLAKINPSYMTRQIAEITSARGRLHLRITGRNPLRPGNAPDAWEEAALQSLTTGMKRHFEFINGGDGNAVFRFMAPLWAEGACLKCHAQRGAQEGELLGGLSVTIDAGPVLLSRETHVAESRGVYFFLWMLGIWGIIVAARYLSQRHSVEARLQAVSLTDDLTGLYNRRGFFALAAQQLKLAQRAYMRTSLVFLDLDRLKGINDRWGHAEGDRALVDTAGILRSTFRESDIIARIGGDEFVVLIEDTYDDRDGAVLNRLEASLRSHNASVGRPYPLALSVGVAHCVPDQPCSLEELINRADALMYQNKQQTKDSPSID
jgi:diguanylate cyclase (GGDEF)-like protein